MKRMLILAALVAVTACASRPDNPYEKDPFYARYLNSGTALDQRISETLAALRTNPDSPTLHNNLGQFLVAKGFPQDAEREFERAINEDGRFYPAWYNLGLVRATNGDHSGAKRAFHRTARLKKGHPHALFQLGLIEEKRGDSEQAIAYYAKAIRHNRAMLDVRYNPQILDSKLVYLVLLENYPRSHARDAGKFEPTPAGYVEPQREEVSPEAQAKDIVTPTAPVTDPATQTPPPG